MKATSGLLLISFLILLNGVYAQEANAGLVSGPQKGSLFLAGGGRLSSSLIERFIELAGGVDAPIVVIPTAAGRETYDDQVADFLTSQGATHVTVLHTTDREIANSDSFVLSLKEAAGVWFGGGRQWRLVDAYKGTKTEKMLWEVLDRGGVIGGSSAGATIQGSFLARGDTKNNQIMVGNHPEGFGFLKNAAIDQHVLANNRHFDMFDILKHNPELLGIAIDEGTAMVVRGDQFEVLGDRYVIIYDGSFWSREGSSLKNLPNENEVFYFLRDGDKYNLKNREVMK
jgi:cyanophycinase